MTTASDRILEKLKKIKSHAESAASIGSQTEAETFAAMLQNLLDKHKLEMTDLEYEEEQRAEPVGSHRIDYSQYEGVKLRRTRVAWIEELANIVARAHHCQILVHSGSSRITLVGRKTDVEVAEYMFIVLHRAAEKLADQEYAKFSIECVNECEECGDPKSTHRSGGTWQHEFKPNWARCRGFRPAFLQSFILRLERRYNEELEKLRNTGCTALVRLDQADAAVALWMNRKKENGKPAVKTVAASNAKARYNPEGIKRGRRAADAVSLRANGIKDGEPQKKLQGV